MNENLALLATLQQADSFFPAGAVAFSWGLETLVVENRFRADRELEALLVGQLQQRWAVFDRAIVAASYAAAVDLQVVAGLDHEVEAMILARELREGSRRAGASLLSVHERLATPNAAAYRSSVRGGIAWGHLPVVQGVLWRGVGMSTAQAQAVSAHTFCVSLLGAVLRLGAVGHLQAQETLVAVRPVIADLLAAPAPAIEECYAFAPMAEIAAMRHEVQSARLFAN